MDYTHAIDITLYYIVFPMPHIEEVNKIIVIAIATMWLSPFLTPSVVKLAPEPLASVGLSVVYHVIVTGVFSVILKELVESERPACKTQTSQDCLLLTDD